MIRTKNGLWRTLDQPIYVDGKRVLEVWANDNLVYPENGGEFIKIRGRVTLNETYGDENSHSASDYSYHQPAYPGVFSGTAEFAACLRCEVGGDYRPFILTNDHSGEMYAGPGYFSEGMILNNHNDWISCISKKVNRKVIGFTQYRNTTHYTPWYYGKIIYRQNIAAFSMPPEITKSTWYYGNPDTGYSYTARILNPSLTEITTFNNVLYKEEFEPSSTFGFDRVVGGYKLRVALYYAGGTMPHLQVSLMDFVRPNGLLYTDIKHYGIPEADQTEDLTIRAHPLFSVPVTDIMYLGSYYGAPAEMRDVTVADLNF